MAEEERREEEDTELENEPQSEQPEVIYRPIEVEVNLLRRKLNGLVFLVLILAVIVLGVVALMYKSERKSAIGYGMNLSELQEQYQELRAGAEGQEQFIKTLVYRLDAMRGDNVAVAKLLKEFNIGPIKRSAMQTPGPSVSPASDTSSDTGP